MTAGQRMPQRIDALDVVVPVRNEELLLGDCIESILRSRRRLRETTAPDVVLPSTRIVVVLDSCTDGSAEVAAAFGDAIEVLEVAERSAGGARRRGFARVLSDTHSPAAPVHQWICSTDADSTVPESWLTSQFTVARGGAALALGRVQPEDADLPAPLVEAWRRNYSAEDRPIHGANLGVRADIYAAAGGFPALTEHEDVTLVRAVHELGQPISILPDSVVTTSGRLLGRTPGGFAGYLRTLRPEAPADEPAR